MNSRSLPGHAHLSTPFKTESAFSLRFASLSLSYLNCLFSGSDLESVSALESFLRLVAGCFFCQSELSPYPIAARLIFPVHAARYRCSLAYSIERNSTQDNSALVPVLLLTERHNRHALFSLCLASRAWKSCPSPLWIRVLSPVGPRPFFIARPVALHSTSEHHRKKSG